MKRIDDAAVIAIGQHTDAHAVFVVAVRFDDITEVQFGCTGRVDQEFMNHCRMVMVRNTFAALEELTGGKLATAMEWPANGLLRATADLDEQAP